jgi:hypothetical protein
MSELETLVALVLAAVALAALGAPYPAFLALGGVVVGFVPRSSSSAFKFVRFWRPWILRLALDISGWQARLS